MSKKKKIKISTINKNRRKTATVKKEKTIQPKIPKCAKDVSSNWKALSNELSETKTQGKKRRTTNNAKFLKAKQRNLAIEKKDVWFDNVEQDVIEQVNCNKVMTEKWKTNDITLERNGGSLKTIKDNSDAPRSSKHVAMDCEFVGIGRDGSEHMLARVSIVNITGEVLYDKFVAPQEYVVDYRTEVSGVRHSDLRNAPSFSEVQKEVADLIKNKVLVGHSLWSDLKVLLLDHPRKRIRDVAKYKPYHKLMKTRQPSLKNMAKTILSLSIQDGEHSSIEDARAAMNLYLNVRKEWEKSIKDKFKKPLKKVS